VFQCTAIHTPSLFVPSAAICMLIYAIIVPSAGSMPHVHIPVRFRSHPILMSVVNGPEATEILAPVGPGLGGGLRHHRRKYGIATGCSRRDSTEVVSVACFFD
jgi:hypothetical protein